MWSKFVDCIRRYISQCFDESRRVVFHKSVENSIDTVHAICSSRVYQNGNVELLELENFFILLTYLFPFICYLFYIYRISYQSYMLQTSIDRSLWNQVSTAD